MPRPTIEPLNGADELRARRHLVAALIDASTNDIGWSQAERLALDVIDNLRADGLELVSVRWPS